MKVYSLQLGLICQYEGILGNFYEIYSMFNFNNVFFNAADFDGK